MSWELFCPHSWGWSGQRGLGGWVRSHHSFVCCCIALAGQQLATWTFKQSVCNCFRINCYSLSRIALLYKLINCSKHNFMSMSISISTLKCSLCDIYVTCWTRMTQWVWLRWHSGNSTKNSQLRMVTMRGGQSDTNVGQGRELCKPFLNKPGAKTRSLTMPGQDRMN